MKDIQNLVYKFMEREEVTLKQALLQASLGMCAKTGDIAEIVRGVVYNGYPYTEERKKRNAEHLGEVLFYWVMLASTCDISPEQIIDEYISAYIKRMKITKEEEIEAEKQREKLMKEGAAQAQASIVEMLKYVKETEQQTQQLQNGQQLQNQPQLQASVLEMGKHMKERGSTREGRVSQLERVREKS
jgi:NTP pyrophosphatase (non-canonical NTP hydrolase)